MSILEIHQIPTRQDNYVYLLRVDQGRAVGVIDPSDAGACPRGRPINFGRR